MTKGKVSGIIANMVTLAVDGPVAQNEICYILLNGVRLMAEVIKVTGNHVYVQVFESTRGLKVGAEAEFTGHMLEVQLGPGMLSKNYDGLQNDLDKMEGVFLHRGEYTKPLDEERLWHFKPIVKVGDKVRAGDWLGEVEENFQPLKMMAPFRQKGVSTVKKIADEGDYTIHHTIAVLTDEQGNDVEVDMVQRWPVKLALTAYAEKLRPYKLLIHLILLSRVVQALFLAPSVQVRRCCNTLFPSRQQPTLLSWQLVVSVPTRWWKSSRSFLSSSTPIQAAS